jgi:exosortase/archaeosortase family protein
MNKKDVLKSIFIRYILLIILPLNGLFIFYLILIPLTLYPLYSLFYCFFDTILNFGKSIIYVQSVPIEIINACVAGSAYYLLLIFNLSTPNIKLSQRTKMISFSFLTFLLVNILRIFILSIMYIYHSPLFEIAHKLTWYAGSVILVIIIWFYQVKTYKIKEIPFYSDLRFLYKNSFLNKK